MKTVQYILPFPPSVNGYWRAVQGRNILSKRGRAYREAALDAIGAVLLPMAGRLQVSLDLHPPDARRRDVDNYSKGVLDALTHANVWGDDEQIDKLNILKCPKDKDYPRVVVTISEMKLRILGELADDGFEGTPFKAAVKTVESALAELEASEKRAWKDSEATAAANVLLNRELLDLEQKHAALVEAVKAWHNAVIDNRQDAGLLAEQMISLALAQ